MKIYKTQSEVEKDIKNGVLAIEDDVKFECSISIQASIVATKWNIIAQDITAWDINARDISAGYIDAIDINARDINAIDIIARDIKANNITANIIWYYAFCCVYNGIKCKSIRSTRRVYQEPICLDGKLEIVGGEK